MSNNIEIVKKLYSEESAKQFALESKRDIEFLLTNGLDLPFESNTFDEEDGPILHCICRK